MISFEARINISNAARKRRAKMTDEKREKLSIAISAYYMRKKAERKTSEISENYSWTKIGAKVICINDTIDMYMPASLLNEPWDETLDGLTKNEIYTIREFVIDNFLSFKCSFKRNYKTN